MMWMVAGGVSLLPLIVDGWKVAGWLGWLGWLAMGCCAGSLTINPIR
jgi:hypothetical protein